MVMRLMRNSIQRLLKLIVRLSKFSSVGRKAALVPLFFCLFQPYDACMNTHSTISISFGTIVKTIVAVLVVWGLLVLHDVVLVVITAIVIASATEPGARAIMKYGVPRALAIILVYGAIIAVLGGIGYFFVPTVLQESATMLRSMAQKDPAHAIAFDAPIIGVVSFNELATKVQELFEHASGDPIGAVSAVFGGITSAVLVIVLSFYFAVQERGIEEFLRIVTPIAYEDYIVGLWYRTKHKIGRWMQGQFILGLLIGVFTYLGLTLLEVPYALVLSIIAGLFEIIPLFGPVLSALPAVAFAFVSGGFPLAGMVVVLYLIIQQFENHLIYPLVVTQVVGVPPVMVILSLVVGLKLAGFFGVLLAVPFAALLQEIIADWDKERHTGHVHHAGAHHTHHD
jgi:predicted PurR-regulated permease PerM